MPCSLARNLPPVLAVLVASIALVACTGARLPIEPAGQALPSSSVTSVADPSPATVAPLPPEAPSTTVSPPPETTTTPVPPPPTTTTTAPPPPRLPIDVGASEFATVAGLMLVHPSPVVERVAFHESSHDGAQTMTASATAAAPTILDSRERGTGAATAVDVVVDPAGVVRAPVSGTVKRAGSYVLYCKHRDDYLVIARPIDPSSR